MNESLREVITELRAEIEGIKAQLAILALAQGHMMKRAGMTKEEVESLMVECTIASGNGELMYGSWSPDDEFLDSIKENGG
jgi:hypothetical protein